MAIEVLQRAYAQHPYDREILIALATIHRDEGRMREAIRFARELTALNPDDPNYQALLAELERDR